MLHAEARRAQRILGLREETVSEIAAITIVMVGTLLLLSLASQTVNGNLIGRFGHGVYSILTFVFGSYVAYLVPGLTLAWGVSFWSGRKLEHMPLRVAGMFGASVSICALVALPYADADFTKQEGFRVGGALGNFIAHRECMYLKSYLGPAGCYLLLGAFLLISLILVTDLHVRPLLSRALALLAYLHPRHWIGVLMFWRSIRLPRLRLAELYLDDSDEDDAMGRVPDLPQRETDRLVMNPPVLPGVRGEASRSLSAETSVAVLDPEVMEALEGKTSPLRKKTQRLDSVANIKTGDDLLSLAGSDGIQEDLPLFTPYELPALSLFKPASKVEHRISREEILETSETLERTLSEFGISAQVVQVTQGPTVTRFEIQPAAGVKVSKIASLENDIAMCMKAESVRIIAPIPGKGTVGLEIPNRKPSPVFLREILSTDAFRDHSSPLAFALGKTISGEPFVCDLAAMPHLLIAGTTGSGKSVCLNSIVCSILYRMQPEQVKFIMIDPKRVELNVYRDVPHLLAPVVCEARKASAALTWAVEQMEERYKRLAALGVRNIDGYNAIVRSSEPHPKAIGRRLEYMPHIVIVVDELADLMLIARNEVEDNVIRLAQMSRAVGMHLIIATQRPSVNVITGIIKANFPSRIAFQVSSKVDSRTILDGSGAEALLGKGDMLFSSGGSQKPVRLQGCYVSDEEVERVADYVRGQQQAQYLKQDFVANKNEEVGNPALSLDGIDADESKVPMPGDDDADDYDFTYQQSRGAGGNGSGGERSARVAGDDSDSIDEELFRQAIKLILVHRKASVSMLQRKLKIGFARAGRVMDMIEEAGVVGPSEGSKVREIIVDPDEYLAQMESKESDRF